MNPLLAAEPRVDRQFERLYRKHAGDVYRYAAAVLRNQADAEDATQTTFLNAYRALERGERPEKPQNWLIAIAHNVCRERFRQQSRRPQEVEFDEAAAAAAPTGDGPSAGEIRSALGQLTFNQRAALVMRELEGRPYEEIAATLAVSVSAVETLLFRARRALREQLEGALSCSEAELALSKQLDGRLPQGEQATLRAHLRSCPDCTRLARRLRAQRSAIRGLWFPLPASLAGWGAAASVGGGGAAVGGAATAVGTKVAALVAAGALVATAGYGVQEWRPWAPTGPAVADASSGRGPGWHGGEFQSFAGLEQLLQRARRAPKPVLRRIPTPLGPARVRGRASARRAPVVRAGKPVRPVPAPVHAVAARREAPTRAGVAAAHVVRRALAPRPQVARHTIVAVPASSRPKATPRPAPAPVPQRRHVTPKPRPAPAPKPVERQPRPAPAPKPVETQPAAAPQPAPAQPEPAAQSAPVQHDEDAEPAERGAQRHEAKAPHVKRVKLRLHGRHADLRAVVREADAQVEREAKDVPRPKRHPRAVPHEPRHARTAPAPAPEPAADEAPPPAPETQPAPEAQPPTDTAAAPPADEDDDDHGHHHGDEGGDGGGGHDHAD